MATSLASDPTLHADDGGVCSGGATDSSPSFRMASSPDARRRARKPSLTDDTSYDTSMTPGHPGPPSRMPKARVLPALESDVDSDSGDEPLPPRHATLAGRMRKRTTHPPRQRASLFFSGSSDEEGAPEAEKGDVGPQGAGRGAETQEAAATSRPPAENGGVPSTPSRRRARGGPTSTSSASSPALSLAQSPRPSLEQSLRRPSAPLSSPTPRSPAPSPARRSRIDRLRALAQQRASQTPPEAPASPPAWTGGPGPGNASSARDAGEDSDISEDLSPAPPQRRAAARGLSKKEEREMHRTTARLRREQRARVEPAAPKRYQLSELLSTIQHASTAPTQTPRPMNSSDPVETSSSMTPPGCAHRPCTPPLDACSPPRERAEAAWVQRKWALLRRSHGHAEPATDSDSDLEVVTLGDAPRGKQAATKPPRAAHHGAPEQPAALDTHPHTPQRQRVRDVEFRSPHVGAPSAPAVTDGEMNAAAHAFGLAANKAAGNLPPSSPGAVEEIAEDHALPSPRRANASPPAATTHGRAPPVMDLAQLNATLLRKSYEQSARVLARRKGVARLSGGGAEGGASRGHAGPHSRADTGGRAVPDADASETDAPSDSDAGDRELASDTDAMLDGSSKEDASDTDAQLGNYASDREGIRTTDSPHSSGTHDSSEKENIPLAPSARLRGSSAARAPGDFAPLQERRASDHDGAPLAGDPADAQHEPGPVARDDAADGAVVDNEGGAVPVRGSLDPVAGVDLGAFFEATQLAGAATASFGRTDTDALLPSAPAQTPTAHDARSASTTSVLAQFFESTQDDPQHGASLDLFANARREDPVGGTTQMLRESLPPTGSVRTPCTGSHGPGMMPPPPMTRRATDGFAALRRAQQKDAQAFLSPELLPSLDPSLAAYGEDMGHGAKPSREESDVMYINQDGFFTQTKPDAAWVSQRVDTGERAPGHEERADADVRGTGDKDVHSYAVDGALRDVGDAGLCPRPESVGVASGAAAPQEDSGSDDDAESTATRRSPRASPMYGGNARHRRGRAAPTAFVFGEAEESDDETRTGGHGGLAGIFSDGGSDSGDDEHSDDDRDLEELLDDERDEDEADKDEAARLRYLQDRGDDDAAAHALHERAAKGLLRSRRRNRDESALADLLDEDADEDALRRRLQAPHFAKAKRRCVDGDRLDDLAGREDSHAFVQTYAETHKPMDDLATYEFLQAPTAASDDESAPRERLSANEFRTELLRHSRAEQDGRHHAIASDDDAPPAKLRTRAHSAKRRARRAPTASPSDGENEEGDAYTHVLLGGRKVDVSALSREERARRAQLLDEYSNEPNWKEERGGRSGIDRRRSGQTRRASVPVHTHEGRIVAKHSTPSVLVHGILRRRAQFK
ncbi:hypothetical protein MSPP1_003158 [Malassezia sp. CBS 17886]|nr:hypothetical protein MSPP1_003158 [Malassezia sp. CBS 17886]